MEGQRMEEFSGKHAELTRQIIGVFFAVARSSGTGSMSRFTGGR